MSPKGQLDGRRFNSHFRKHLSEDEIRELLGRLIDHYVFLVNAGEQPLVIRKLASSLATIFTKPKTPWTRALLNLAASIANGKYISEEQCQSFSLEDAVLPVLSETQLLSLLYFSSILGEELDRFNTEMSRTGDEKRISENIDNAFHIVEFVLRRVLQQESSGVLGSGTAPGIEAINTYHVICFTLFVVRHKGELTCTGMDVFTGFSCGFERSRNNGTIEICYKLYYSIIESLGSVQSCSPGLAGTLRLARRCLPRGSG